MQHTGHFAYAFYKERLWGFRRALILIFAFSIIFANTLHAQEPPRQDVDINQFIGSLFPVPSEDIDYAELFESLLQLYTNPLDINIVTADELSGAMILTDLQIRAFLQYREQLGPFISLYELQAIPGFDLQTIYRLLPFIALNPKSASLKNAIHNPDQHFLILRSGRILETQKGFAPLDSASKAVTRYRGNPYNTFLRYRNARSGYYSFGITFEKDAGEKWWAWEPKRHILGTDFTSFHAQVLNRGRLKNLIIGDFRMQTGQGMVMGAGFSLGKGSEVIKTAYRSTLGFKPYTSSGEADFFRGIAFTWRLGKKTDISLMYSNVKRDATLDESADGRRFATSLPLTGYHRTPGEIDKHHNFSEQNAGAHLLHRFSAQNGQIGITALYTSYELPIRKRDQPYNRYEFSGKQHLNTGIHGDYRWRNFHFFGEGALSGRNGIGAIAGAIASFGKKWDATFLLRHYAKNFHTTYGNPISEATRPSNENAVYGGLRFMPHKRWQFSGYFDRFWFPWLRYQVDAPSKGSDYYLHLLFKPDKRLNVYALVHQKQKQKNAPENKQQPNELVTTVRRTAMLNFEYEVPLRYAIRTRCQLGDTGEKKAARSKGITIFQDLSWHFPKIELSTRLAWFNTDDYDSRQYAYEKDMLYAFSVPAYYDSGTRYYMMLRYTVSKNIKIWARWSQTRYSDLQTISSGLNEIKGNKRSEIKMQFMYQL
ncbi:ComEA family DNA-binding protein [Dyadobacter aurulentus]|uniref:ComEA family DNA-binding protein n=1 Tax=Dyadobacter sp. UC 10 TaxID=2605428 RepID=UPI0011F110C1|nr:helix-hairpin-helix domain-containing protein [Dyadobacter sp. UC 10]KAA0990565.1 helix-hairpin-helix domain-containing protein [Dyadobacter sp. UC 10]